MTSVPASHTRPLDAASMVLVVFICLTWGFNQPAVKLALPDVPPLIQCAIRSSLATVIVLGIMRLRGLPVTARDGTLAAGGVAGLLFGFEFLLIYRGLLYTTASRAVLFIYLAPFFVVLGARIFLPADRFNLMQWAGLLLAFVGMIVAFGVPAPASSPHQLIGDLMMALAALFWAATTLVIKASSLSRVSPEKTLLYQLLACVPIVGFGALDLRRADHGHAFGGGARLARLPDRRGGGHVQPVVRPDREVLGQPPVRLHVPDPAVRGGGRPPGAGRALDPGFRAGRGAGGGGPHTRQPAPLGLYLPHQEREFHA